MSGMNIGFRGNWSRHLRESMNITDVIDDKPVETFINVAVELADLGMDIPDDMISRIAGEKRIGTLIRALEEKGIEIPDSIKNIVGVGGKISSGMNDGDDGEVEPTSISLDNQY